MAGAGPAGYLSGGQQRAAQELAQGVVQSVIANNNGSIQSANVPGMLQAPAGVLRQGSAAVYLPTDRSGMRNLFANGARRIAERLVGNAGPESGRTNPTESQPFANTRVGVSFNDIPHRCGLPINMGLSFKVPYQYYPNATGQQPHPWYTAVQRVGRSSGAPNAYPTKSAGA
jgi:hypothetical protein